MEFYGTVLRVGAGVGKSFNSQRDGILRISLLLKNILPPIVSIPNGMEFYCGRLVHEYVKDTFQFPTGWNSTSSFLPLFNPFIVSIPNGMEFY